MSSLGEFLNAMVELRKQKAQVAEYNASQQIGGMEALGKGFGGLLSGLGEGMQANRQQALLGQQDALANQLYNRANPPRAMADGGPAVQGPADLAAASMPGGPMTTGGPFTGGVKGMQMQDLLDKAGIREERATQAGELGAARISNYASMAEARDATAGWREEREARLREAADAKTANDLTARAATSMQKSSDQYKKKVSDTTAYNNHVALTTHNMATAKTDEDWQKNIDLLTNHYNAMDSMGYKIPFPEIPPSPSQRQAAQAATQAAGDLTPQAWNNWWGSSQADIDKAKAAAAAMPGSYQYPGMQDYQRASPGEIPSGNLQDYMPQGQPAQQQPAGGGGGAAPEGITVTNAQGVKMKKVNGKWVVVQ